MKSNLIDFLFSIALKFESYFSRFSFEFRKLLSKNESIFSLALVVSKADIMNKKKRKISFK